MPEWLLSRKQRERESGAAAENCGGSGGASAVGGATGSAGAAGPATEKKDLVAEVERAMKGRRAPSLAEGATMVTEIFEYLALFRRLPVAAHGDVYCKVSKFLRSRKHYAELRGCTMVVYRTQAAAQVARPDNDSILAVLLLTEYAVEIVHNSDNHVRIFITSPQRDAFHSLYLKYSAESPNLELWKTQLAKARCVKLPSLSNLTVKSIIGQGGGGKVFMVRWGATGDRYYALKVINKNKTFLTARAIRHVASERYLMQEVGQHPFLLRMEFAFQTRYNLFLGTPLCAGGDLATYIRKHGFKITAEHSPLYAPECVANKLEREDAAKKRKKYYGRLSEDTTRRVAAEVMLGLRHLHNKGIVYRDLKPENILITSDGHLKIGDFGLAKYLHSTHNGNGYLRTGSICGTRNYLPPEMLHGKPYSIEADMWSLGVMLYRMMCGCFPFDASRTKDVFKLVRVEHPSFPSVLTPEARSLLGKLLAKEPERRLTIDQAMSHVFFASVDWDALMRGEAKPALLDVHVGDDPMQNFEVSKLAGVTIGEVLGASSNSPTSAFGADSIYDDDEKLSPTCPKGRLIGFEFSLLEKEEMESAPVAISPRKNLLARIVSIDSDAFLSPRRSNHTFV